ASSRTGDTTSRKVSPTGKTAFSSPNTATPGSWNGPPMPSTSHSAADVAPRSLAASAICRSRMRPPSALEQRQCREQDEREREPQVDRPRHRRERLLARLARSHHRVHFEHTDETEHDEPVERQIL